MPRDWNKTVQTYIDSLLRTAIMLDCDVTSTHMSISSPEDREVITLVLQPKHGPDPKAGKLGTE